MKITLNETEIKSAIIMFLETKMSLDGSLDVELSTQGKGGQTIVATIDLDSDTLKKEPKKEESKVDTVKESDPEPVEDTTQIPNPDNDSSLFGSDTEEPSKEEDTPTASPFGNF